MRYKILPVKPGVKYANHYKGTLQAARRLAAAMFGKTVFDPVRPDYVEIWKTDSEPRRGSKPAWTFIESVKIAAETIL